MNAFLVLITLTLADGDSLTPLFPQDGYAAGCSAPAASGPQKAGAENQRDLEKEDSFHVAPVFRFRRSVLQ